MAIVLKVRGTPVPQGSMTCVGGGGRPSKTGKIIAVHNVQPSNKAELHAWRNKIAAAARLAVEKIPGAVFISHDPVQVDLTFTFERPKTVTRDWPSVPPDIDKLARAVLDGLTYGEIWADDGQCVLLNVVQTYPDMAANCPFPEDVLDVPGVTIRLSDVTANRLI
jgi:Holliday junction resolvase RusA-like endonuclease